MAQTQKHASLTLVFLDWSRADCLCTAAPRADRTLSLLRDRRRAIAKCLLARPGFHAWLETLAYASEVFAGEAVVQTWSIQFPWLDQPDFYRSGLPTRTLAARFAGTNLKFVRSHKKIWRVSEISAMFHSEAQG